MALGKTLFCIFIVQIPWETEVIESIVFYWEDVLEMGVHFSHWVRLCAFIVQVSQDTEFTASVEFNYDDGLEKAIPW